MRLRGKRAVVTGGASGIGRATALRLVDEGAEVWIGDIDVAAGEEVAATANGRIRFLRTDITDADAIRTLMETADAAGGLDIVFNNAGASGARERIDEIAPADWDRTQSLLLRSVALGIRFAAPLLAKRGGGAIVNTSSVSALGTGYAPIAYSTAKAGVLHLTKLAAAELSRHDIRVNAVVPGFITTNIFTRHLDIADDLREVANQAIAGAAAQAQPIRRAGRPEDIAAAVAYLASDDAAFVTGTHILVDGGLTIGTRASWDETQPSLFAALDAFPVTAPVTIDPAGATPASSAPMQRRLTSGTMASYGMGAAAYGVKDSGFGTFLLLFYNQVVGVPAATVGLVVMLALFIDAFVDPTVGFLSDRTRGRWGRRHPWMYGAALPIMLGWVLLWNPPAAAHQWVLGWLFVVAVLVRSAVSAYEVPSQALAAELSGDYDERTRIMAYRYLFGWAGGLIMLIAAYMYFLAPAPGYPNGLLNPRGYRGFAIAGALFMGITILVSAIGTHKEIPYLPRQDYEKKTLRANLHEMRETVRNRAFVVLMLAGLCAYTGQGIVYALSNYLYSFVWGFRGATFVYFSMSLFSGVLMAFVAALKIGARLSKPRAAATAAVCSTLLGTSPYWLRLGGLFPAVGDPMMLPLLFAFATLGTACGVTAYILGASMLADVVEDSEVRTGRRSEGVFFAGGFFVQKCTSGIGIFVCGLILATAGFPAKAVPGQVPVATLDRLTLIYACCYLFFSCAAAFFYARFPFGRREHELRMARLTGAPVIDSAPRAPSA